MALNNRSIDWQIGIYENYMPVYYKGAIAGFLSKDYADRLMSYLYTETALNQALTKACTDLVRQSGRDITQVEQVVAEYIQSCLHPSHGSEAIVSRLQQRQLELNLSDQEFTQFCQTFQLFPVDLHNIYAGDAIDDSLIAPLAKILGIPQPDLWELRKDKKGT